VINAVHEPQSILLLGGTSEIGLAIVRAMPSARLQRIVLAGRPGQRLDSAVASLSTDLPQVDIEQVAFDADNPQSHAEVLGEVFAAGEIDVMILAAGVLGDQPAMETDPDLALSLLHTNLIGAGNALLRTAILMRSQGHGSLIVLSSVAAVRGRADNYVYGASKAGLDTLAQGLGDSLADSGVSVLVVRPGFVRTRMTAGMDEAPFSADPDEVASTTVKAWIAGRSMIYAPPILRAVMSTLRSLPTPVFRRVSAR